MAKTKKAESPPAQDGVEGAIKKKIESRSKKAGLTLSVSRIHRDIKDAGVIERIGNGAPVFMAAVIEYVISEIIQLSAENTTEAKRKRIMPEDISLAIRADPELHKLMEGFRIFGGDKFTPKELGHEITCEEDAKRKKAAKEARKAAKAAAKEA